MRSRCAVVGIAILTALTVTGVSAQTDGTFSFEDDLEVLAQAVTRLVDTIEEQARAANVDQDLSRLSIAVSVLDIRVRRYERMQSVVRGLEEDEATSTRYIATLESEMDATRARLAEATDAAMTASFQLARDSLQIDMDNVQAQLEHTRKRLLESQNQLMDQQRLVRDVESVIDSWLESLQLEAEDPRNP